MQHIVSSANSNSCNNTCMPLVQLRLDPEQNDQKRAAEEAVKEVEDELEAETDESKIEALKAEVAGRKDKLSTLIDGFQVSPSWTFT